MPVIKNYDQSVRTQGAGRTVSFSADQFGAAQGRALQQVGAGVTNLGSAIDKAIQQQDLSNAQTELFKANDELSRDLQNTVKNAAPGDKKAFEDYNKRVEERLSSLSEGIKTRAGKKYFDQASLRISSQLNNSSFKASSASVADKTVRNYEESLGALTNAVVSDPSAFELNKQLHEDSIQNIIDSELLDRATAEKLRDEGAASIAKSAIKGWVNLDPEYAKEKIEKGDFDKFLDGDKKVAALAMADQGIRAKEIEDERRKRLQEELRKKQISQTQDQLLADMVEGKLTTKDVLNSDLEAFGSGSKQQFLNMMKASNSRGNKTDPAVFNNIFHKISDGSITNEDELNKYVGSGINFTDLKKLRSEIQGRGTAEGRVNNEMRKQLLNTARTRIAKPNKLTGISDPKGEENYSLFLQAFNDEFQRKREEGVPASELLNPMSKEYLGRMVNTFQKSRDEILKSMMQEFSGQANSTEALDPKVEGYAKQHNMSYGQALAILKKRGYGK